MVVATKRMMDAVVAGEELRQGTAVGGVLAWWCCADDERSDQYLQQLWQEWQC